MNRTIKFIVTNFIAMLVLVTIAYASSSSPPSNGVVSGAGGLNYLRGSIPWVDAGVAGAIRPATANTSIRATCPLVIQLTDGGTAFVVDCDGSIDYSSYPTMGRNAFGVDTTGLVYGNGFAAYDYLGNYAGITAGTVTANGSTLSTPTIAYQSAAGLLWRLNSGTTTADLKSETGGVAFVGHAYSPYVIAAVLDAGSATIGTLTISDGSNHDNAIRVRQDNGNQAVDIGVSSSQGLIVLYDNSTVPGTLITNTLVSTPVVKNNVAANPVKLQGQVSNNNVAVASWIDNSVNLLVDGGLLTKWTNNNGGVQVADVRANGTLDLVQGQGICFPSGNCQADVASTISGLTPAAVVYANSPTTLGTDATASGMYIDAANHRVAVGTTVPQTPFEVKISGAYAISTPTGFVDAEGNTGVGEQFGNLTITKSGTTDSTLTMGASGANQGLFLQAANVLGTGDVSVRVLPTATTGWAIFRDDVTSGVSAGVALASSSSSAPVSIAPNKVRALTAFSGGDISIGSTTDQSRLLYVNGTLSANGQVDVLSHKIINVTNGSGAQDAAAYGQLRPYAVFDGFALGTGIGAGITVNSMVTPSAGQGLKLATQIQIAGTGGAAGVTYTLVNADTSAVLCTSTRACNATGEAHVTCSGTTWSSGAVLQLVIADDCATDPTVGMAATLQWN